MNRVLTRLLGVTILAASFMFAGAQSASADYYGGWRWPGTVSYPQSCLDAGTNILTYLTPNKHNVAASNSCKTDLSVKMVLDIYASDGTLLDSCPAGPSTNYAQCGLADVTGSGDYWFWSVSIFSGTKWYGYLCSNKGFAYSGCFQSAD